MLVDLLARRAVHFDDDHERAELFREIGPIYDASSATTRPRSTPIATPTALEPDRPDVLDALARLAIRRGGMDEDVLAALERLVAAIADARERARVELRAADVARLVDCDRAQRSSRPRSATTPSSRPRSTAWSGCCAIAASSRRRSTSWCPPPSAPCPTARAG